jgi:hypothetical protein
MCRKLKRFKASRLSTHQAKHAPIALTLLASLSLATTPLKTQQDSAFKGDAQPLEGSHHKEH